MKFKKYTIFCFFIIIIILSSCTGSKAPGEEPDQIPVNQIKERVNHNSNLIKSLEASGSIAFDSPEMSGQGSIDIKIKKPDSVFIEIDGPFGISIVKASIARDSFVYYNVQDNRVIRGPSTEINIGAIMRIKLSFDELINSFSGSFLFPMDENDSMLSRTEQNYYLLFSGTEERITKYYIEPSTFLISKYMIVSNGETVLDVEYSKYEHEQVFGMDIYFPNQINISRPDTKQKMWLSYSSKEINKENLSFRLKVPKSAKETQWR
jgi:hypothetical protein